MNPAKLLTHFDRISSTPSAIPRFRRFILDLAVRGKLVEQNPKDEPASELLQRIDAEKVRLVKEGKIRKQEPTPQVGIEDQPFELPTNWQWVRFGGIADFSAGRTPSRHDFSFWNTGDYPWVSIADMRDGGVVFATKETVSAKAKNLVFSSEPPPVGTLVMSFKLTIGKISRLGIPAFHNEAIISIHPHFPAMDAYLFKVLPQFSRQGDTKDAIKGATLNRDSITNILLPLPPLAEQQRIIAKVDELMGLCDQLEVAQAERESRRDRLAMASLHRLNNGADADAFREDAHFFFNRLPRLTTRPEHIQQLRQTVLNLAVRGQLVPQDPKDEPVSELLERVAAQKTKAGNVKTGRDWVGDIAKPVDEAFVIPKGWAWTRIANTVERVTVGYVGPMKDHYVEDGIPFLRSQNVRANRFREDGLISISPKFHQTILKSALAPGDVVVVRSGNVGTACVIPPSLLKANCSDLVVVKHPIAVHPTYLCFYLNSLASAHIEAGTVGVALTHFNTKSVATMPLPLPPLAEQDRIVAKVDELMALCDRLEAQLTTAQIESRLLLEAVLHEALSPALQKIA